MVGIAQAMLKKGYIPLGGDAYAGIAWQGEYLKDFWMWNRKFTAYKGGIKHIRTVRVTELKDAALHYWRDGWVPLKPIDEDFLRRMERALREHQGLKREEIRFSDSPFLKMPEPIPEKYLGPEIRQYLGLPKRKTRGLKRKNGLSKKELEAYKQIKGSK